MSDDTGCAAGRIDPLPGAEHDRVRRVVSALCKMHNNPPKKFGWMEQTTLHDACELLTEMRLALTWYAEMATAMRKATLHVDTQVSLHVLKELALDGGKRGNSALGADA